MDKVIVRPLREQKNAWDKPRRDLIIHTMYSNPDFRTSALLLGSCPPHCVSSLRAGAVILYSVMSGW
jgi:hypothetical protein